MIYDGIIEGKTVRLRSMEERDAEITYRMRTDPIKSRYIHKDEGGVEHQREFIRWQRSEPGDYYFVIEDLNGNVIGMKALSDYNVKNGTVESGRFLGFGSQIQNMEALMLSFDFAFETLGVQVIHMNALENNVQMLSIQKRFGVEFTGRFHEEGMEHDNVCSELTKESYDKTRPRIDALIKRFANRE
ncbi:MAG: GNAT family N-acetyltransferase [Lachnospiraceae bacterium]|jgi:RimJ/RimL family protein N-acetyltransferase|nr:GNAT family N-acetyltransferase [Lachnospiraceae bacterium]